MIDIELARGYLMTVELVDKLNKEIQSLKAQLEEAEAVIDRLHCFCDDTENHLACSNCLFTKDYREKYPNRATSGNDPKDDPKISKKEDE